MGISMCYGYNIFVTDTILLIQLLTQLIQQSLFFYRILVFTRGFALGNSNRNIPYVLFCNPNHMYAKHDDRLGR